MKRTPAMASVRGWIAVLACAVAVAGCARTDAPVAASENLQAVLWVQTAAEYRGITQQAYSLASARLEEALADSTWTAALEQTSDYRGLPPAVILDVDETVLDNSPHEARLVEAEGTFTSESWEDWVLEASAPPVPGALEFVREAVGRGVAVFFVTNRNHRVEDATRRNLEAVGFPIDPVRDNVLTREERSGWGRDKSTRRAEVARTHRILLLIGDDFNDFVPARVSRTEREALEQAHGESWGRRWIVLPNPLYGSWERALYDYDLDLTAEEQGHRRRAALDTGR